MLDILTSNSEFAQTLRTVLTQSVVQKLTDVGSTNAVDKYTTLLSACVADNVVNEMEKKLLLEYASSHKINEDMHNSCLRRIGWTPAEFHQGMKKTTTLSQQEGEENVCSSIRVSKTSSNNSSDCGNINVPATPEYWAKKALAVKEEASHTHTTHQ